jgi:hypothetical protein
MEALMSEGTKSGKDRFADDAWILNTGKLPPGPKVFGEDKTPLPTKRHDDLIISLPLSGAADATFAQLREFGNGLRPVDEKNGWFFQIVFELMDAALSDYQRLRAGCNENNSQLSASACRNLLELAILTKYVLISEANARRFADDRLIDGCEIITSLKDSGASHRPER